MSKKGGNKTKTAPKPPMANKGPKKKPRNATATAETTNRGISQKVSSKARAAMR